MTMNKKEVVISTSALNSYGFRVMTDGIDIEQYKRNPVLLWMHRRADEVLPLGFVTNLRIDGDKLIGTPVFDENDEFAKQIKQKWDDGIIKMVSAGLEVIELSDDPSVLLKGQKYATVTKSKLIEVSIVDIGANDEAIALMQDDGKMVCLSAGTLDKMNFLNPINNNLNNIQMKSISLKLGLADNASEQEVLARIEALQGEAAEAVTLREERENMIRLAIVAEVENAVKMRKITADKKDMFVEMGLKVGIESLKETFSFMPSAQGPTSIINQQSNNTEYKTLSDVPADMIAALRESDFNQYARLYKAEYGVELSKNNN